MSDDPIDTYGLDPADGDRSYEWSLNQPAPIDWPARFRKAADVAEREGAYGIADHLRRGADELPPAVVEAIGRELSGKDGE
ncbi:MAG TPA: hypothetical protein VK735_18815 [Pseudonocardia sp.]|uniref:hypothetical protein n=1 Tax=Pseudonocardia sp. TaxID=60912 RepID=UPI002BC23361|nr:hypothetical protein [Pseudonocardia sp.]HTF49500.1 hypothetical protein [Pseudonocardia sp.]